MYGHTNQNEDQARAIIAVMINSPQ